MHIPTHVHPKDYRWWLRFVPYVSISIVYLLACFGWTPTLLMDAVFVYAIFRALVWVRGGFQCIHCLIRMFLATIAWALIYANVPLQYLIAGIMMTWVDYFLRFGHQFIREDAFEVRRKYRNS